MSLAAGVLAASNTNVLVAFGAGMLSFLSPCVLPLVPGYLSMMSGISTANLAVATRTDTRRLLRSSLLFVAGFTLVFTALGAQASVIGRQLQQHQRALERVAGVLTIVMGLFIAGVFSNRALLQERRFHISPARFGVWAPPVMGMAFAFGWTPCIGPVLGVVLSLAASEASLGRGILLLFVYSLGLGVPFVAAGVGFGRLSGAFGWVKRHYGPINLISGLLLAGFGLLLLTGNVTEISRWLLDTMEGLPLLDRLARS